MNVNPRSVSVLMEAHVKTRLEDILVLVRLIGKVPNVQLM